METPAGDEWSGAFNVGQHAKTGIVMHADLSNQGENFHI